MSYISSQPEPWVGDHLQAGDVLDSRQQRVSPLSTRAHLYVLDCLLAFTAY